MNRFCLILIAAALLISGCATTDSRRIDAWKAVALEEQKSEAAKWEAQGTRTRRGSAHEGQTRNGLDGRINARRAETSHANAR